MDGWVNEAALVGLWRTALPAGGSIVKSSDQSRNEILILIFGKDCFLCRFFSSLSRRAHTSLSI